MVVSRYEVPIPASTPARSDSCVSGVLRCVARDCSLPLGGSTWSGKQTCVKGCGRSRGAESQERGVR